MPGALDFATSLAQKAGTLMRENFSLGMKKEWKEDTTPVTATDTKINEMVLKACEANYPQYSFIGEEGSRLIESEYSWVCDPIDGTMPFSYGWPTFAFSLALTRKGESILGVIYDPICDRLLHAEKGTGTFLNGKKIRVSEAPKLDLTTFVETTGSRNFPMLQDRLIAAGCRVLGLYSCVYGGMLVAAGELVGCIYKYDKPWDAAAVKIIVEEAGGKVTDLKGVEQRYDATINGFIASNGVVHQELIELIQPLL